MSVTIWVMLYIAIGALFTLVYTYFAYPILIALLAKIRPMQVRKDPGYTPMVSALIPVFNAKNYIEGKMESLLEIDYPHERFEILLYSDQSDDGSDEILKAYEKKYPGRVRFFRAAERAGKPSAVNFMRKKARGELLLMTDIRQTLNIRCLRELVPFFSDDSIGAVSGNLELVGGTGAGVYWRYENWIRRSEGNFRSMVGVTGPIYMIRKKDMSELPAGIVLDDMWVPMRLRLDGKRIAFAPEAIAQDDAFEDGREFGRKTRTLAGNYQLFSVLPKLLIPFVNPSWFEVFSHKLLRLVCPWALILLFVSSVIGGLQGEEGIGAGPYCTLLMLLTGQAAFYVVALLGGTLGKLGNVARTFVVLNYAAIVGLWRFLRQSQKVTW